MLKKLCQIVNHSCDKPRCIMCLASNKEGWIEIESMQSLIHADKDDYFRFIPLDAPKNFYWIDKVYLIFKE